MRDILSKLTIGAAVAGALLVSACGGSKETTSTVVDTNTAESSMEGSVNDVTAVDAAGASDNMVMDDSAVPADNAAETNGAEAATNAQ
ncbi:MULTISPECIES: hypothetical protein [Sphingomonadales]|uniref:Circumsporozoite protein n=2 Tax=Edaphosphingomonas TaxID=3423724 RepID=A0A2T4HQ40_9SPHN|nr:MULTISPECIES: hypothetical protein [Sphingomonas]AGH48142.1 hypothetical protein G432_02070 [Sphingomonas sp. MM-1]MDX3884458.1 hypothetical protein [Sphingomonas sp.]OHT20538.1 hypothetical protein BHE75_02536 [Sphingomonas haloaromaticamans]PTD17888.1 hypothetical protein CV103_16170 [Sphingomonas fennica]